MFDPSQQQCFRYISEILETLASTNQHERVLHLVVDRIVRMIPCQICAVVLIDPKTEYLHIENSHGLSHTFCNEFRRRIATRHVGELLWTGKPMLLTGHESDQTLAEELKLEHPFKSCACVQIAVDHQTLGYIHIDSGEHDAFTPDHIEMLRLFADIAGVALNKSHLFEENLRLERVDKETGLEKYLPFLERVQGAVSRAQEFGEQFGILLLDVDNFKDIVNTYGYEGSRHLLKEMAGVVRGNLRHIDGAGRYGFDEFILLLENADLDNARTRAQSLRRALAEHRYTSQEIPSTVSIGVATYPLNGTTAEDLILTAKKALFEAQRAGRNKVGLFLSPWTEPEGEKILL